MPSLPIERGKPGPGLVAHVLIAKYYDHLPLYRQSEIYAREGVDLSRSTMADWIGKANTLLEPLLVKLREHVFAGERLHSEFAERRCNHTALLRGRTLPVRACSKVSLQFWRSRLARSELRRIDGPRQNVPRQQ